MCPVRMNLLIKPDVFFNDLMQNVDIPLEIHMFWNQCTHSWNKKVIPAVKIQEKSSKSLKKHWFYCVLCVFG